MTPLSYDKIFSAIVDGEKIKYGILAGNKKIVFIKAGVPKDTEDDGDNKKIEDKFADKYLVMAHRIRERIGATVICASNSSISGPTHFNMDKTVIKKVIAALRSNDYELYFAGNSDGGYHSLLLAQQFPKTVAFLGINSSWSSMDTFLKRIQSLSGVKKIFVYGTNDVDFDDIVPKLKMLECDNLEILVLDGVDHDFTGKIDDFVALIDLI